MMDFEKFPFLFHVCKMDSILLHLMECETKLFIKMQASIFSSLEMSS